MGGPRPILLAILLASPIAPAHPETAMADLFVNGEARGTIEFHIDEDGRPYLPALLIRESLAGIARPETIAAVAERERLVAADELGLVGVRLSFDAGDLALNLDVEPRAMRPVDLSLSGQASEGSGGRFLKPEPFALILGLSLRLDPLFVATASDRSFRLGAEAGFEPSISAFGFAATASVDLGYSSAFSFRLNEARIVRDFPGIGARMTGGYIASPTTSMQSGANLLGLAFFRDEGLPGGRSGKKSAIGELLLEREALVTIEVNGNATRRISLAPGSYRLSDLPFSSGLNDVLVTIDEEGEEPRSMRFGVPFDSGILGQGELDYSLAAGVDRSSLSRPFGSGYLSVGIGRFLELGADAEAGFGSLLGGLSAIWAAPIGTIGVSMAASMPYEGGSALVPSYGGNLSWRLFLPSLRYAPQIGLAAEYKGSGFSPPREEPPIRTERLPSWRLSGQIGEILPGGMGNLSVYGDLGLLGGEIDDYSLTAGLALPLPSSISLSISTGADWSAEEGLEPRLSVSLSVIPPDRRILQYRHDFIGESDEFDIAMSLGGEGSPTIEARGDSLLNSGTDRSADVFVEGSAGSFDLAVSGEYRETAEAGTRELGAGFSASTAFALAGGHLAAADSFGDAFAILVPAPSLALERVVLRPSNGVAVASEGGRPALVAGLRPYRPFVASIEMPESPPDRRPDPEEVEIMPGYRSVTIINVRAAASIAARGKLVDEAGLSAPNLPGDLLDAWGGKIPFAGVFTDEEGIFECYGLKPGPQTIEWGDGRMSRFSIAEGEERTMIELGEIRAAGPSPTGGE